LAFAGAAGTRFATKKAFGFSLISFSLSLLQGFTHDLADAPGRQRLLARDRGII
jgi:hypothetical protein